MASRWTVNPASLLPLARRCGSRFLIDSVRSPLSRCTDLEKKCPRTDLKTILIIGAGPIVIGQACEFDYSGAQACKALRDEGYRVVLVNSNPATIMTDRRWPTPSTSSRSTGRRSRRSSPGKPDALLPTMGGQTALNCALDLADNGVLEKYNVELIGAKREAIRMAEDRELFRVAMGEIGLECPTAAVAHTLDEALKSDPRRLSDHHPPQLHPWAAVVRTTTAKSWSRSSAAAWSCRRPPKCWWKSRCWAGEFEEVVRDTADNASSSARSKTSTRWRAYR